MKTRTRTLLTAAVAVLAPVVLLAGPAAAFGPAPAPTGVVTRDPGADRAEVERILDAARKAGDRGVTQAAEAALAVGTPEALRRFLDVEYPKQQSDDDHVWAARALSLARKHDDRGVERGALAVFREGRSANHFRHVEHPKLRYQDDAVAIARLIGAPTTPPELRAEAKSVLDDRRPEVLRAFVERLRAEPRG
ncbi:hypothetical protein ACN20G_01455 [Streptomyces sp. BI20]|uniref:hypothetical protein n=1 Tax=Streptomyces sp. BI20 TaxID=3403460 RepID=UPI003C76CBF4